MLIKKYNLIIGETTAERIKCEIGSAIALAKIEIKVITGRDSITGLPKQVEITSSQVNEAILEQLLKIVSMIKSVMEEVPPELSSDIIDKGIVMTGGTSTLRNFDRFVTENTGVPAFVAEDPLRCVAKGTGIALENLEVYRKSLVSGN